MLPVLLVRAIEDADWFRSTSAPYLVVDTDYRIHAVNNAYERATGRARAALVGELLFDAFPDNPSDPVGGAVANLASSLESVFIHGRDDWMGVQRYDVPDHSDPSYFVRKIWTPVNSPVRSEGRAVGALHHVEDVTAVLPDGPEGKTAELEIAAAACTLSSSFPTLPFGAVLGVLAHSYRNVIEATGERNPSRAAQIATRRLEALAGHRALPTN